MQDKRGSFCLNLLILQKKLLWSKRSQVTLFVILAIVIIAGIGTFLLLRGRAGTEGIPSEFQPIEEHYLDCIKEYSEEGVMALGAGGGFIYTPDFIKGSDYMPTSSQLDFFGESVPYWYYVSGNNLIMEQRPTKRQMAKDLERFLEENLYCDFSDFIEQGFIIDVSDVRAEANILDNKVEVFIKSNLNAVLGEQSIVIGEHKTEVNSKLGKFYDDAVKIYNYEKQNMFIEDYVLDVLRLYAPVDGVEMTCSPKVWMKKNVDKELKSALEANLQAIRFGGGKGYFVQNLGIDENVNLMYDSDWPTKIEIWDSSNGVMMAEPVGLQQGLGILGFCYVPYHFVYDLVHPVLIQIYDEKEIFQFPVSIIIDKNKPRKALAANAIQDIEPELCKYKTSELTVYTYDTDLQPVEASVSFECLGETCDLGKTEYEFTDAVLSAEFPQCLNGYLYIRADGFSDKRILYSTNLDGGAVDVILDRVYEPELEFTLNSRKSPGHAVISFTSPENSYTAFWPEQKKIRLSEGMYNLSVYAYTNADIYIPGLKKEQCSEVPRSGLGGLLGLTEEKCFNIEFPAQTISNVIIGGGTGEEYITEDQLKAGKLKIDVQKFNLPKNLEDLQDNYNLLEVKPVSLDFE